MDATRSVGLVTVFNPETKLEEIMKHAADMLLQAKGDGGNTIKAEVMG